jgi:splicing factor 3A subunit 3
VVPGWENMENKGTENGLSMLETVIDLDYYSTVEELMEVGPEKLKEVSLSPLFLFTQVVQFY